MIKKENSLPIVFILAKGRSGTTLLQTILDAHPNTVAPFESRFVIHFKAKFGAIKKWTIQKKQAFLDVIFNEQKISLFWDINKQKATELIYNLPENTNYGEICKQIYLSVNSIFDKEEHKIIIDKNPIYALLVPAILEVYPNAKFIHCIRDYRACVNSTKKLQPLKGTKIIGYEWLLSNFEIEKYKKKYPKNFNTIRYEDLLISPEKTLQIICDYLDISYSKELLEYHKKTDIALLNFIKNAKTNEIREIREIGANSVHKNLKKPLDASLINNWKKKLTQKEIVELDLICGSYGIKYQYKSEHENQKIKIPFRIRLKKIKIQLYYKLPIFIRELKSKPSLAFINTVKK